MLWLSSSSPSSSDSLGTRCTITVHELSFVKVHEQSGADSLGFVLSLGRFRHENDGDAIIDECWQFLDMYIKPLAPQSNFSSFI